MALPFALLLLAAQIPGTSDPAAGERVRLRVAINCRIDAGRLAIESLAGVEDTKLLVLKGDGRLSDGQLRCYGDALTDGDFGPMIEDEILGRRYDLLARQDMHTNARRFLRQLGLLDRVPQRLRGEPLARFARRLEGYCGAPLRTVLRVEEGRMTPAATGEDEASRGNPRASLCAYYAAVVAGYDPLAVPPPVPTPVPIIPAPAD